jgi:hypothetical protein
VDFLVLVTVKASACMDENGAGELWPGFAPQDSIHGSVNTAANLAVSLGDLSRLP